jgi:excisionase family DNA binding protein
MSPAAAYVIASSQRREIERVASRQPAWLRAELMQALASMQESGRQWVEAMRVGRELDEVDAAVETMTVADAAEYLGVSERRVRCLAQDEVIDGYKIGRTWVLYAWSVRLHGKDREQRRTA